jgi:two-component system chemotaxis response regulator CheB
MLRSAAVCCGSRSIGVVLTGTLGDGASGLWAVDRCNGITVVQDPEDAAYADMPLNALSKVRPDHVVPLAAIPGLLHSLAQQPAGEPVTAPASVAFEVAIASGESATMNEMDRLGRRSVLTCPDCQGVMWEIDEGELVRFRCHVGHAYTAELMSLAFDENLRRAFASALRALEERLALARKLQKQAENEKHELLAANWRRKVAEFQQELEVIQAAIHRMENLTAGDAMGRAAQ